MTLVTTPASATEAAFVSEATLLSPTKPKCSGAIAAARSHRCRWLRSHRCQPGAIAACQEPSLPGSRSHAASGFLADAIAPSGGGTGPGRDRTGGAGGTVGDPRQGWAAGQLVMVAARSMETRLIYAGCDLRCLGGCGVGTLELENVT